MKHLLEYDEWIKSEYCRWKGVVCKILKQSKDSVKLNTPTGIETVSKDECTPMEKEEQLIMFQQISAPTIAY